MTIADRETVRQATEAALRQPPVRDDPRFADAREGQVGSPVLARTPERDPAFWLVPLISGGMVCGLARVDLAGRVAQVGVLGAPIEPAFFEAPPDDVLGEIRGAHPEATLPVPQLSYDVSPLRWAWRVEIEQCGQVQSVAYVTPGGWYERPAGATHRPGYEG